MIELILIDMDGVIADYYRSVLPMTKATITYDEWPRGCQQYEHLFGMTYDEVMASTTNRFWADIPKTPWMDALLSKIASLGIESHILTSPPYVNRHKNILPHHVGNTVQGKLEWILKHCPEFYNEARISFSWRKYIAADRTTVLIDDSESNIDSFREHGGIGMLMPGLHNRRYDEYDYLMEDPEGWIRNEFNLLCPPALDLAKCGDTLYGNDT